MTKYILIFITMMVLSSCSSNSSITDDNTPNNFSGEKIDDPNDIPSASIIEPEESDFPLHSSISIENQ